MTPFGYLKLGSSLSSGCLFFYVGIIVSASLYFAHPGATEELPASLGVSVVQEGGSESIGSADAILAEGIVTSFSTLADLSKTPAIIFRKDINSFLAVPSCEERLEDTLVVDINFFNDLISHNVSSLEYVVAHEIGHFLQYENSVELKKAVCNREDVSVKTIELIADSAAGWILAKAYSGFPPQNVVQIISTVSDYEFSNVRHHGMVSERVSAYGLGVNIYAYRGDISMDILMAKSDTFTEVLFYKPPSGSSNELESFYKESISDIYR